VETAGSADAEGNESDSSGSKAMEIHAPHHPTLTLKDALVHLCIVTVGILIALSLEGALEWWHHRELVAETRQRLESEIRSNRDSIQTVLRSLEPAKAKFVHAIDVVGALSNADNAKEAETLFGENPGNVTALSFAYFNTAAYSTAEVTGAFGFMEYSDALRYADAYDLQALYARMQDNAEKDVIAAAMLGTSVLSKPAVAEVEDVKRQLRLALGGLLVMEGIAKKLDELYAKALTTESANGE
jgi:hypothetical protein